MHIFRMLNCWRACEKMVLVVLLPTVPTTEWDDRPETKKRGNFDLVKAERVEDLSAIEDFGQSLFSLHEEFERRYCMLPGQTKANYSKLKSDHLGVCVFPNIHAAAPKDETRWFCWHTFHRVLLHMHVLSGFSLAKNCKFASNKLYSVNSR